jgi:hypothetical protein
MRPAGVARVRSSAERPPPPPLTSLLAHTPLYLTPHSLLAPSQKDKGDLTEEDKAFAEKKKAEEKALKAMADKMKKK